MRIKSFIASTVQEALKNVKREMGDASIILETRNIEEGDIKSRAGQILVEVIAAENNRDNDTDQAEEKYRTDQNTSVMGKKDQPEDKMSTVILADHLHSGSLSEMTDVSLKYRLNGESNAIQTGARKHVSKWIVSSKAENTISSVRTDKKKQGDTLNLLPPYRDQSGSLPSDRHISGQYSSLTKHAVLPEVQTGNDTLADRLVKEDLIEMAGYGSDESSTPLLYYQNCDLNYREWPEQSRELFNKLRIQQVEEVHSRILINEVLCRLSKDEYDRMNLHCQMLREGIIRKMKISDSFLNNQKEYKTTVFIGAAGTGKTTSVLKLASEMRKRSDKEILLISIRGNSATKLKKTADRIGATLRTVTSHREIREIIARYDSSSHIFIDTPGISYLDASALSGLKGFLEEIPKMEIHLVVSATTRYADIKNSVKEFAVLPVHRLLFTMLDETCLYGSLLSAAMETQIPLSYISAGQEIPEDISPVTAEMIADMVLQNYYYSKDT